MYTSRVSPAQVDTKRLDPDYYHPDHLETERILRKLNAEPLRHVGSFWAGPFGSELPSSLYLDEGIPLFRVGNVGSMQVLLDGMAYLDLAVHEHLSASEVQPGDLLIVKASVGEKICKVPSSIPRANVTQHIIAIRPNGTVDSDYLSAFLFSRYGRSQLVRRSLGSIIQYLGVNDARTVLYPPFDRKVQTYVGDKVRQAEQLRGHARIISECLGKIELDLIPVQQPKRSRRRGWRVSGQSLSEQRLDSKFYSQHFLELDARIAGCDYVPLGECLDGIRYGASVPADYVLPGAGLPFVRGTELERNRIGRENAVYLNANLRPLIGANTLNHRDILITRSGTVGIAAPVPESLVGAAYGSFMMRLSPKREWASGYLSWCLNSWLGRDQIERLENGAVQMNINIEELSSVRIWRAPDEQRKRIERLLNARNQTLDLVDALVVTARVLIEYLIDGQISETELIEAQQAIEHSDYAADRALLSRLTTKGLGSNNAPKLFPDLDSLYLTLENARSTAEEVK